MTSGRTLRGWLAARPVKDSLLLRSRIAWGDRDAAEAAVWGRWFFGEPPPPPSGPSIVQTAGAAVYGSIISATFPAPVTPGNSIVVLFDNATTYNAPPAGCSDDQGNAYTLDATLGPERHGYGDDYTVYVYRAHAVSNAMQTVGVSFVGGVSHAANIYAFEISGLADAPPADTFSASLVAGAGGTIGLTAAHARSVSLGAVRTAGGYTVTPDGGASVIEPYTPPVYEFGIWRNNMAAGDVSLSFTLSAAATKALFGVLYEGAAAGGGSIQGGLSSTLTGTSASASAALSIRAQGGIGLATLTASAGASLSLRASGAAALGQATLAAAGELQASTLSGSLSATLGQAWASAAAALDLRGALGASVLDPAVLSSAAALAVGGQASVTLAAATASGLGTLAVRGQLAGVLQEVSAGASGSLPIGGDGAGVLGAAALAALGRVQLAATLAGALDPVQAAAAGAAGLTGQGAASLGDAQAAAFGRLSLRAQGGVALAPAVSDGEAALRLAAQMSAGQLAGASCAAGARLAVRAQGVDGVLGEALCAAEAVVSDPGLSLAAIEALAAAVWAQPLPLPASAPPYVPGPGTLSAAEIARAVHSIWARTLP